MSELQGYGNSKDESPFTLASETVAPGFDYRDKKYMTKDEFLQAVGDRFDEL